jgi:putative transcriptional regulator
VRKFTQVLSHELQQAADILLGKLAPGRAWHPPAKVDVRAIRAKTGLSQTHFARRFGFSTGVVREWGARPPPAGGGMTFRSALARSDRSLSHYPLTRRDCSPCRGKHWESEKRMTLGTRIGIPSAAIVGYESGIS